MLKDPLIGQNAPVPPGVFIKEDILEEFHMTQGELAARLGVSRRTIHDLVNAKCALTAEMALRLARLTGTTAEFWLNSQRAVDLAQAERRLSANLQEISPLETAEPI